MYFQVVVESSKMFNCFYITIFHISDYNNYVTCDKYNDQKTETYKLPRR